MNKLRLSSAALSALLAAALITGCSIKEDRSSCPCALILDFSGVDCDRSDSLSLGILSAGDFLYRAVVPSDDYGTPYRVDVPKEEVWINAFSVESGGEGFLHMLSSDRSSLTIPYGEQCPQVNSFTRHETLSGETLTVPVTLHKNYCDMTITMLYDGELPYVISVIGGICGYDRDGSPAEGDFLFEPTGSDGVFHARIPRQTDSFLRLTLSDEEEVLREFAIGEYIIESGYDWEAEDLDDVNIQIDYMKTNVTVTVDDWSKTLEIETVI